MSVEERQKVIRLVVEEVLIMEVYLYGNQMDAFFFSIYLFEEEAS
jgi:hypothetical protein